MSEQTPTPPVDQAQQPAEAPMMTFGDLEKMAEAERTAGQGAEPQPVSGQQEAPAQAQPDKPTDPFTEALSKKGFKQPEDLLKSYDEAHATITRLSQERAKMAQDMDVLMQMQNAIAQGQPQQSQTQGQAGFDEELFKEIQPRVEQEIDRRVEAKLHEVVMKAKVEAKAKENPEEFNELNPIMLGLLKQYPQVGALPNGFEMVYEKAKEVRNQRVSRLMQSAFGPDVDLDKVRQFFSKTPQQPTGEPPQPQTTNQDLARSAYLPSGSPGNTTAEQKPVDYDTQIRSLMQSDKIQRDTPDKIMDLWWKKVTSQAQR